VPIFVQATQPLGAAHVGLAAGYMFGVVRVDLHHLEPALRKHLIGGNRLFLPRRHAPPIGLDAFGDRLHSCVMSGPKGAAHRRADSWPTFRRWRCRQGRVEYERHGNCRGEGRAGRRQMGPRAARL